MHIVSTQNILNCIAGVMVSMLTSSMVVHGFEHGQVKPKTICSFSAKHDILRSKSKGCLAQNLDNAFEWSDISTCRLLFQ